MNAAAAEMEVATVAGAPASASEWTEPRSGDVIAGKYEVERVLGAGGMGIVVEARHRSLSQRVAVKLLLPGIAQHPDLVRRFVLEARAAAAIKSEHVVRVFDVGEHDGAPYIVMERLAGQDLEQLLEEKGPLSIDAAIACVLQACEALAEAHAMGVVHRDLKPANLFMSHRADGSPLIKVLDFGIAKIAPGAPGADPGLTATGSTMGSPRYMSPEQIRNAKGVDGRADVWALGVVLQELITGRAPFDGDSGPALCAMIVADEPVPLRTVAPDAPEALERIVLRCLEKDPSRRWPDVTSFARALEDLAVAPSKRVVEPTQPSALAERFPGSSVPEPSWRADEVALAPRRSPRILVACAVAIGVIASATGIAIGGGAATTALVDGSIRRAWIQRRDESPRADVPALPQPTPPVVTLASASPPNGKASSSKRAERSVPSPAPPPVAPPIDTPSREASRDPLGDRK